MKHLTFPSIKQYRNVIKNVGAQTHFKGLVIKPVIKFRGTCKLHGTNSAIVYDTMDGVFYAQSRDNVLSLMSDNAGFCQYFETNRVFFEAYLRTIAIYSPKRYACIFGEWAGGNIQKGVAINSLPKMFVVFAIRNADLDEDGNPVSDWSFDNIVVPNNHANCYSIEDFKTFEIDIDFNNPELSQNQLVQWTNEVEAECPVGKHFGVEGVGEGIVFHASESSIPGYRLSDLIFKSKGEKHSVTKVKTLAAVDVEVIHSINELVSALATDNRFNQGITVLTERGFDMSDQQNTREFVSWIRDDVIKEEKDTIIASELDFGKVMRNITTMAGKWFNSPGRLG